MNFEHISYLPSPEELLKRLPILEEQQKFVLQSRTAIKQVLNGTDSRFLLIVGPCSIHDIASTKEYAEKLRQLIDEVDDTFLIVMRVYFEKPRTTLGWKGFLYDPWLDGSCDIHSGLIQTRQLFLDLTNLGIPIGAEFLDPLAADYFSDLVSWGCIGARTSSSQIHRQLASALPMPVAFKNGIEGSVDSAIHGIMAAAVPHTFMDVVSEKISVIKTSGNPDCHVVLRGGERSPNYDPHSIHQALDKLRRAYLAPNILVDCSHENSLKQHEKQPHVFESVIRQVIEGNECIRGALLESHLFDGNQQFPVLSSELMYGVSVTDPCLGWERTELLVKWAYRVLQGDVVSTETADKKICESSHIF